MSAAAFDPGFDLSGVLTLVLVCLQDAQPKLKFKGGGQECPPHTLSG
jgi:hypothetical protein